ncbi:MAG: HNH endonuclease [Bdellovibrionota bacterium]
MEKLHQRALRIVQEIQSREAELIRILQEIDSKKSYLALDFTSLFVYATRGLGLSEASAYQYISVSRKAREVPELLTALERREITVAKAKSICSAITDENKYHWLKLAKTHSTRELEASVSVATGRDETKVLVTHRGRDLLSRAQEILAQKYQRPVTAGEALEFLAESFLSKEDPLLKKPTLHVKSKVRQRDKGKCQFKLRDGKICGSKTWTHFHHIESKADGGQDTPDNLTTLCAAHHRMVHLRI